MLLVELVSAKRNFIASSYRVIFVRLEIRLEISPLFFFGLNKMKSKQSKTEPSCTGTEAQWLAALPYINTDSCAPAAARLCLHVHVFVNQARWTFVLSFCSMTLTYSLDGLQNMAKLLASLRSLFSSDYICFPTSVRYNCCVVAVSPRISSFSLCKVILIDSNGGQHYRALCPSRIENTCSL